ncbi:MAG: TraR/DksA C4-type zinc finger protein [Rhodobacteraceae bacterium]|jgi:RNA polymerase-binding transcription factor DksA|nr:TraR/DksA C4-type zinc finger protein [Paracoccaceae bacterium]
MASVEDRRKTLEARLAELEGRLQHIEAELDQPADKDWEEAAIEREDDEVLEGMGEQGLHEIEMIRAALGRIAEGEYGYCVKCGTEIAVERLDAVPATPFCRDCAR